MSALSAIDSPQRRTMFWLKSVRCAYERFPPVAFNFYKSVLPCPANRACNPRLTTLGLKLDLDQVVSPMPTLLFL